MVTKRHYFKSKINTRTQREDVSQFNSMKSSKGKNRNLLQKPIPVFNNLRILGISYEKIEIKKNIYS